MDLSDALNTMTAEELRSFLRDALEQLDDEPRGKLVDALVACAVKGGSGWRPRGPSQRVVDESRRFARAAARAGYADPHEMDAHLRGARKAFLAGDAATARALFEALLLPVANAEIDLGQHELVDEVLAVDVDDCTAQYLASVYATTPLDERARALAEAIDAVGSVSSLWHPLAQMERVAADGLAGLDVFLPRWLRFLEEQSASEGDWESDRERWLIEAVQRLEDVAGLARIGRASRKPAVLRAWCDALVERGDWAEALRACEEAAKLVGRSQWRGEFRDAAALAAQQLGRRDTAKRLEVAWLESPSLERLVRWLDAGNATAATVVRRARQAGPRCPRDAGRQRGLLHVLTGDAGFAARLLAKAPGLGWSSETHPGHLLFPAFAALLAEGSEAKLALELCASLEKGLGTSMDLARDCGEAERPSLATPSIAELFAKVRPAAQLQVKGRKAMLEAMRAAATRRVEGLLSNKRRRHYGHAATLVACCLELAPAVGEQEAISSWVDVLRDDYSRFYAFQRELKNALASIAL